jgi:hypothetical protein
MMRPTFVDGSCWDKFEVWVRHVQRSGHSHTGDATHLPQIIMTYVHQAANFAAECMFDSHWHTLAIAKLWHVQREKIVSQPEVVTELLR